MSSKTQKPPTIKEKMYTLVNLEIKNFLLRHYKKRGKICHKLEEDITKKKTTNPREKKPEDMKQAFDRRDNKIGQ